MSDPVQETKTERADRLLAEYSTLLIAAQTSRRMTDWIEAGQAFNRFLNALVEAERPMALPVMTASSEAE